MLSVMHKHTLAELAVTLISRLSARTSVALWPLLRRLA